MKRRSYVYWKVCHFKPLLPTYANFNVSFVPRHLAFVDYFPLVKHNQILPKADLFLYGWYDEKELNCLREWNTEK